MARRRPRTGSLTGACCALWLGLALPVFAAAQTPFRERQRVLEAEARERAGDLAGAQRILQEVLTARPADLSAILMLERVSRSAGDLESVLPWIERALAAAPEQAVLRQVHLRILGDLGRTRELGLAGGEWIRSAPRELSPYREFALTLAWIGARDSALAILERGRRAAGGPPALAAELADLHAVQGRWGLAAGEWMRVARQGPASKALLIEKLRLHASTAAPGIRLLVDSLWRPGAPPEFGALAAVAAAYAGDEMRAREIAAEVLTLVDSRARRELAESLAQAAREVGRPGLASWAYEQLLDAVPAAEWVPLALPIAQFHLNRGDTVAAAGVLQRTVDRAPPGSATHRSASALLLEVRAARGEGAEARALLEEYARRHPRDATLPRLAAVVAAAHLRAGDRRGAEKILERFLSAEPSDPKALGLLAAVRGRIALYEAKWDEARDALRIAASALTGVARTEAIELVSLLEACTPNECRALAAALRAIEAGEVAEGAARVLVLAKEESGARPGLLLWAARHAQAARLPLAAPLLEAVLRDHPRAAEAPAALLGLAEMAAAEPGGVGRAQATLERLILEYPDSALVPLARRRLEELRARVPSS